MRKKINRCEHMLERRLERDPQARQASRDIVRGLILAVIVFAMLIFLSNQVQACEGFYMGVGTYQHSGNHWDDSGSSGHAAEIGYLFRSPIKDVYIGFDARHHSDLYRSDPAESTLDAFGIRVIGILH